MTTLVLRVAARYSLSCEAQSGRCGSHASTESWRSSRSSGTKPRYKEKLRSDEGNTIYTYSERQVALRNRKKAERLEKLRKSVHKLRARVKKDLQSKDPDTLLTALVVGLMDHTAERVGNEESKEERGHVGVTGWQKGHVSFSKGKATIKYTGKSGVKQKKTVTEKALVSALRRAHESCTEGDLFCHDGGKITAAKVNAYLKEFDVTAKDLRGLHANSRMQENLKAVRKKGGELPTDAKERKNQLKAEFKKALEITAEDVGHEPSTLRSQYLVPGLEEEYMRGRVMSKMVRNAVYSETTLDEVMAGMGMLLCQSVIVSDQFFDESEIRKYLALRRSYHDTFAEACEDLAEAIAAGSFGEAAKVAVDALQQVGAIPARDTQRALRAAAKALRGLRAGINHLEGDIRLRRAISLAYQVASAGESRAITVTDLLKELLKAQVLPAPVRTFFRKALKHLGQAYGRFRETANPGAWFDMPPERKDKIRDALTRLLKERDEVYDRIQDPEKRQAEYRRHQERVDRLKDVAGVNLHIIQQEDSQGPSIDELLKKESKLEADGPTSYVQEAIERMLREHYSKEGVLPREYGKLLTQLKKARTLETVRKILKAAEAKRTIYEDTAATIEKMWSRIQKNLAVRKGKQLVPLRWEPISVEDFQKKHSTGRIVMDSSMDENAQKENLGRVSRALEDLEGIFGKGFCGKHTKPLEFNFEGAIGTASASYFAYEKKGEWQPRVRFGEDYGGLLAHELSHYFDDLLATQIEKVLRPESYAKYPEMSRELFGRTGVPLAVAQKYRNVDLEKVIPELAEFVDTVLATPDYARWSDMTSSAHDDVYGAIQELTGQEPYDLPKEHPYRAYLTNAPRFKSQWDPTLLAKTEERYKRMTGGDDRKITYYNSGVEIWARMCEQYVATKLADVGIANPWLTQLTYDLDELPQMMDQDTFEEKIVPLLDRVFATIKERNLVAHRVASRYLTARGSVGPAVQALRAGRLDVASVEHALEELEVRRNGNRWSVDADWLSALGPRHQKRALTVIRALGRIVLEPEAVPREILGQLAFELEWLQGLINKADDSTFQHGVFEIVPHGVTGPAVRECLEALDQAYKVIQPKFPKVLYGRVYIVKNLSNHLAGARYQVDGDVVYLSLKAKNTMGDVYALCHEFGHRFFHKFWKNKAQRDEFMRLSTSPEYREVVFDAPTRESIAAEYIDIARARRDGRPQPQPSVLFLEWMDHTMGTPAGSAARKLGVRFVNGEDVEAELRKAVVSGKDFTLKTKEVVRAPEYVTEYGKTGGWMENFAEAFAHHVLGRKLPSGIGAIMEAL